MRKIVFVVAGVLGGVLSASAQIPSPQDVYENSPILNYDGTNLPGNNPAAAAQGCTPIPGDLVQILKVGTGNIAHLPSLGGVPTGGDTILFETVIGQGMFCELGNTGQFSTSFYPPPASGTLIYARVFNAPTTNSATYWGQSATFAVNGAAVFDASARGLKATRMPKGSNPATTDSDGDGQTDYQELVANTNPLNPGDVFRTGPLTWSGQSAQVSVTGQVGRAYTLQRSTELPGWADVSSSATGVLPADASLILTDPNPPSGQKLFYRVKVSMP